MNKIPSVITSETKQSPGEMNNSKKIYRILSLDGGGVKGLLQALFIERLDDETGFLDKIDFFAGTSTGGLIALALAKGVSPAYIKQVYLSDSKYIFDDSWLDDVRDLGSMLGANYDNDMLETVLRKIFSDKKLGDLQKNVLVTAFDLDNEEKDFRTWKPKMFHNFTGEGSDRNVLAFKAALYTAAAPVYFPSVDGYIDGGVCVNNPSMCALAQTQDKRYINPVPLEKIKMLSIGTGVSPQYINGKNLDWGYGQWLKPLLKLMMEGANDIADYQCRQLLNNNYFRIQPVFPWDEVIPMDGVNKIPFMKELGENYNLQAAVSWIQNNF